MTPFFVLFFDILPRLPPNVRFGGAKSETNRIGRTFCLPANLLLSGAYAYFARRQGKAASAAFMGIAPCTIYTYAH